MLRLVPTLCAAVIVCAAAAPAAAESVEELEQFLAREHKSTEAERRAVLAEIGAAVPDKQGRFRATRKTKEEREEAAGLDWLAALKELPPATPGLDEVIADVDAIRKLAATDEYDAARVILDFAFTDVGLVYRDECGRYLRKMAPRSLPALIVASEARRGDKARYARYQLQRMDREQPLKALSYAGSDDNKIAILKAYADVLHREAVIATLQTVDDVSPKVRAQARATWMEYITGRPPKEAPKKRLQLPGGKLTDEPQPLYLNSRELANLELRRLYEKLFDEKAPRKMGLVEMTEKVFAYYDDRRTAKRDEAFERGVALAGESKWAEAAAAFDRVLVVDPEYARRGEMAPVYLEYGHALKKQKRWSDAAIAYGKAHAVAPSGPKASMALAGQYYARGRAISAGGGDGTAMFERALEHYPKHKGAAAALAGEDPDVAEGDAPPDKSWMIFAGGALGAFGLVLLIVALRRRHS